VLDQQRKDSELSNSPYSCDHDAPLRRRPRAVIGHPRMGRGGSEARVLWLIETLKDDYDITVITTGGWDTVALNSFYGTNIDEAYVTVRIIPIPWIVQHISVSALRGACYQRFARKVAKNYDLRISAYNTTDWGLPAIHFIADFSWHRGIREKLHPLSPGLIYRDSFIRKAYLQWARSYGKPSERDVLQDDLIIANSQWTDFVDVPWDNKEEAFVMIGRISPEKQVEHAIAILEAVRERGFFVKLHLCGQFTNDAYGRKISQLCKDHAEWIIVEGLVSGTRKATLLSNCRFGIQTCGAESFGISVAEMVKAGAIVFAPNDGGQTEVLAHLDLLFLDIDDAVTKICTILADSQRQRILRQHLNGQSQLFNAKRFMDEARIQITQTYHSTQLVENTDRRIKVVIGHPGVGFGGSESTVMWLIEALRWDCDVTVVTTRGWDLDALNDFYGTTVCANDVTVRIAPVPLVARGLSVAALRGACYQRFARTIAEDYDVRISAYNLTDWGLPAIHFIADFSWQREIRDRIHPASRGLIYRDTLLRRAYLAIASAYGKPSGRNMLRDDLVIANSRWTAEVLKLPCGLDGAAVISPPVWTEFPTVAWENKELSFAMIGRIAPEKQIERAIVILEKVRRRGYSFRFHICGEITNDAYGRRISRLCKEYAEWIILEGRVSGRKKAAILSQCKFGIQATSAESFGIAVAEMVKAGAIVFAPIDGGTAETLQDPALLFANTDEAVEKIVTVLDIPSLQTALRIHLVKQSHLFSATTFMREARACIAGTLRRTSGHAQAGPRIMNEVLCTESH